MRDDADDTGDTQRGALRAIDQETEDDGQDDEQDARSWPRTAWELV